MFITRHKIPSGFKYKNASQEDLERIKKLRIPPNWTNVKIDKSVNAKIQVTGYDIKGRKQYIYNKQFVETNKTKKFKKMYSFDYSRYSRVLKHYINKKDLSKDCVIANMIKLMEDLNIRVGNETYKKENGTYGICTLLKKHLSGNKLKFVGKKGISHEKIIKDSRSLDFIKRVYKIKGPSLFYYSDSKNITASDLNTFLREKVQTNVTCKDIRTYCANKIFLGFMKNVKRADTEKERKKDILKGIDYTSEQLGNTRKICRDSYLCPSNINKFI